MKKLIHKEIFNNDDNQLKRLFSKALNRKRLFFLIFFLLSLFFIINFKDFNLKNYNLNLSLSNLSFINNTISCETAYAEESEDDIKKDLEDTVDSEIDSIDTSELEKFLSEIDEDVAENLSGGVKNYIEGLIKGEFKFSFLDLINIIVKTSFKQFLAYLPIFITIIIISILCGLTMNLSSGFLKESTNKLVYMVCFATITVMLITILTQFVSMSSSLINNIQKLVTIIFPILLTLMTAIGSVATVTVYQPLMSVLSTLIINIISKIIIPIFIITIVFTIIGNLSSSIKLEKFTKFFKSFSEWLLGIIFSLFIAFVSVQGITGVTIDAVSIKATKFALSSYVPILGGYMSDGFDLVTASCILIKNAVGVSGIVLLLGIILVPVLKLLIFILGLKLTAAIVEPVTDKKISDMLSKVADCTVLLITAILGVAFMLFIVIMLIIYSFNMGAV